MYYGLHYQLKFYEPVDGEIFFNHLNINEISPMDLRKNCGVVMEATEKLSILQ